MSVVRTPPPTFPREAGALPYLATPPRFLGGVQSWGMSGSAQLRGFNNLGRVWTETYNTLDARSNQSPRALLTDINRSIREGTLWTVKHPYCWPDRKGIGGGLPVVDGGGQTGESLLIRGATPNVTGWLKAGDLIQVEGAPVVIDVVEDVDTDDDGNATIVISPPLFPGSTPEDGASVEIDPDNIYYEAVIVDVQEFPAIDATRYISAGFQITWREQPRCCEELVAAQDDFELYAPNGELDIASIWDGQTGNLTSGSFPNTRDASLDGILSQYLYWAAVGGGDGSDYPTMYGQNATVATRPFTGLDPNTDYRVRFQMNLGHSVDSTIGHHPAAHEFVAGVAASETERVLVGVWVFANNIGMIENPAWPSDVIEYMQRFGTPGYQQAVRHQFPQLEGWVDYNFIARSNDDGEITLTIGKFSGRNFQSEISIENIRIETICP
jgi:hypothetical protein